MAPMLPCAGKAQPSRWLGPGGCEARGSGTPTPGEALRSAAAAEINRTLALLLDSQQLAPPRGGPSGDARLRLTVEA